MISLFFVKLAFFCHQASDLMGERRLTAKSAHGQRGKDTPPCITGSLKTINGFKMIVFSFYTAVMGLADAFNCGSMKRRQNTAANT